VKRFIVSRQVDRRTQHQQRQQLRALAAADSIPAAKGLRPLFSLDGKSQRRHRKRFASFFRCHPSGFTQKECMAKLSSNLAQFDGSDVARKFAPVARDLQSKVKSRRHIDVTPIVVVNPQIDARFVWTVNHQPLERHHGEASKRFASLRPLFSARATASRAG
jgi:hypothetical protein